MESQSTRSKPRPRPRPEICCLGQKGERGGFDSTEIIGLHGRKQKLTPQTAEVVSWRKGKSKLLKGKRIRI